MIIVCPKCLSSATTRLYADKAGCTACELFWDEPITFDYAHKVQGFNPESPGWKILQGQDENIVLYDMHESSMPPSEHSG